VKVAGGHPVAIYNADATQAGGGQVEKQGTAQSAGTHHQRTAPGQLFLAFRPELRNGQLAGIAAPGLILFHGV